MLRDVLRLHPNLDCPEETQFYRPADPFGTAGYARFLTHNAVLEKHRAMDGIGKEEFEQILSASHTRQELYRAYMRAFLSRRKPDANRWFDKSPQNVYGAAMIAADFPRAQFVHIVRNPYDVVSSLKIGKVMKVPALIGACNYWREAVQIIATLRSACPGRVHEVRYEDFLAAPQKAVQAILEFVDEPYQASWFADYRFAQKSHDAASLFDESQLAIIAELCGPAMAAYGYTQTETSAAASGA